MLLEGLAFENLLKAIGFLRHQNINDLKKHRGGHGLVGMAKSLALELTPPEQKYLRRLEEYVVWGGRYPVPNTSGPYVTSEQKGLRSVEIHDDPLSEALFEKLAAELTQLDEPGGPPCHAPA